MKTKSVYANCVVAIIGLCSLGIGGLLGWLYGSDVAYHEGYRFGYVVGEMGTVNLAFLMRKSDSWEALDPNLKTQVSRALDQGMHGLVSLRETGGFPEDSFGPAMQVLIERYDALRVEGSN